MGVWHFHFKDICLFVFNFLIFLWKKDRRDQGGQMNFIWLTIKFI